MQAPAYPVQYITGSVNFMGLELKVRPGVFIPRPETELLVEKVIQSLHASLFTLHEPSILDLCTGSGNIAISLAKSIKNAKIVASDISDEALAIAKENAKFHKCENIKFVKSDLFDKVDKQLFDVIVSNPPYVSKEDWQDLPMNVLCEPHLALYAGRGGLDFYKRIFKHAGGFLKEGGHLAMEIGYDQKDSVAGLINGEIMLEEIVKDSNGIDRIMILRKRHG